jgi:predicted RND superfamily exporter protein
MSAPSDKTRDVSRKSGFFHTLVERYVRFSYSKPLIPILLIALSALGSFQLAKGLRIDTDLRVLLPDGTPSKDGIEEAERRKGSTDLFTIAMEGPSIEAVAQFQKALAESLSTWPEAVWVQYDQDRSFFEERALLYLPTSELEDLRERVRAMIGDEFTAANPLITDIVDEDEKSPASLEGWPNREALEREGLPKDIVDALTDQTARGHSDTLAVITPAPGDTAEDGTPLPPAPPRPDSLASRMMNWHAEKGVWVAVVLVQLNQPSTNALFAKSMYDRGEAMIARTNPDAYDTALVAKVAGAYRNFNEIDQVSTDVAMAGIISFILITGLLWFFVRKPFSLLLINIPLFTAMAWAMGLTYLIYQRLTLLTAFILSLILGLGIEYAVHLYARWAEETRKKRSPVDAMSAAMVGTGRSLLAGAATNVVAMLSLQIGNFEGFREFGVVVSIGIMFALLANWIVMPPVFFLTLRGAGWLGRRSPKAVNWVLARLLPSESGVKGGLLLPALPLTPGVVKGMAIGAVVVTIGMAFGPMTQFENDFRNLRGKSTGAGISYGRAVGSGQNTSPAVILGTSEDQMRSVHETLTGRYGEPADSMLKGFVTIQSFVPSAGRQRQRLEVMAEIDTLLNGRALAKVDSATRADLDTLRRYLDAQPFGFEDLPGWSQRFLTEADGTHGNMGFLYASMRESDAVESGLFQDRFQFLESDEGDVRVASSGFIYADVVRMVKADGPRLALVTFILLMLVTWIDMRKWKGVAIVVGFIALSGFWTYKLMALFGLKLGVFNIVVIPTILSVSVDSVIHLYHRRRVLGAGKLRELYRTTGSAVMTGTLTNMFGFLGLCFVGHKGMQSIGLLAALGIGSGLVVMFTALPAALEYLCPKEPVEGEED